MQVYIDIDEWYPVYSIVENDYCSVIAEIPEDKLEWVNRVNKEFDEVQDYLRTLADGRLT